MDVFSLSVNVCLIGVMDMFDHSLLSRLYRYCYTLYDQESDAYDLLHSAIERCLKSPPKNKEAIYSYVVQIIRNIYIDSLRREKRYALEEFDESVHITRDSLPTLSELDLLMLNSEIENLWPMLLPVEREVLFLWAVEGYSTADVAKLIEKPKNSVLSIIHRMRKRIANTDYFFQSERAYFG